MESEVQRTQQPIIEELLAHSHRYEFFQLVELLEQITQSTGSMGQDIFSKETIRFNTDPKLHFSPSDIAGLKKLPLTDDGRQRYQITVSFMGLFGSSSPTPTYFSEAVCQTDLDQDPFRDFLDIFNHRLISLYVKAWKKYRPHFHRNQKAFADKVASLLGTNIDQLKRLPGDLGQRALGCVGLFAQKPHSAESLRRVLAYIFNGISVQVEEFSPEWINIPEDDQNRLGKTGCRLGHDLSLGQKVCDLGGKFRVVLGPLDYGDFGRLLPGGEDHQALCKLIRFYSPQSLNFDFIAILKSAQTPVLKTVSQAGRRLGMDSWLCAETYTADKPVRFDPSDLANSVESLSGRETQ